MNPDELGNIYRTEADFWWYRGMRAITEGLLDTLLVPKEPLAERLGAEIQPDTSLGLDAGCGTGFNALDLERCFHLRMYGVDVAPLAIQYCRQRTFPRSTVASITELPFGDDCFDLVISFDVLSHLPLGNDDRALKELVRVLHPGGWLLLRVPAFAALRSRHSQWIAETHRYRAAELQAKVSALDCEIVRSTYANTFLSPVAFLKFRIWDNIPKGPAHSGIEEIPAAWLNRMLFAVLKLEAAMIRRGFRFHFGQSLIVVARKRVTSESK